MIASLDVARKQMTMEGYGLLSRVFKLSDQLKASINSLEKFRVLEKEDLIADELKDDNIRVDKTKITIDISKSGYTSKELEHLLVKKHNIQIEKTTFNTITILLTIGATYSRINRLYLALESIEKHAGNRKKDSGSAKIIKDFKLSLSPIKYRPRFAFYSESEEVPLRESLNRVSTMMVTPYPPGIPLLVPGQVVSNEIINALSMYRDYGVEIHGLNNGLIQVMPKEEEERLKKEGFSIMS
jgi:arginine/lysine/ornithine decarboxylase